MFSDVKFKSSVFKGPRCCELFVAEPLQSVAVQGRRGRHVDFEVAAAQGGWALAVHVDAELKPYSLFKPL